MQRREVCPFAHTLTALKKGLSREEIDGFLGGGAAYVLPAEGQGILPAQHYADSRARLDRETPEALVREYGRQTGKDIAAVIQVMIAGNTIGFRFSALLARLRGRPYPNSPLLYELGLPLSSLVVLPLCILPAVLGWITRKERIRFTAGGGLQ